MAENSAIEGTRIDRISGAGQVLETLAGPFTTCSDEEQVMPNQATIARECSKCKQTKPIEEFKFRKGRGSYGYWCLECTRAYARRFYAKTHVPDNSEFISHFSIDGREWLDVANFLGYRIGNDGTVWSNRRRAGAGKGWVQSEVWSRLKPLASEDGHLRVTLYRDGLPIRKLVHHLVLEAFVGPRPDGMEACHFPDWNPANNHLSNLRWDTQQGNWVDRKLHGHARRRGVQNAED